ncbi:hypothetical protein NA57DRAFT_70916 [Rhizodiscina lignyota]|uniref:DUF6594 domain-containing protein n=1 Tax=Rhizodiscina lignyota TaxID=1504668 RepID=A0A9P4MGQ1_9PEZI|nr:hypothetical protein NA57DRAFT_70916 [Rhizodiscina lignyota]
MSTTTVDDVAGGYPGLARQMGTYPGLNMFKRFAELNARNLLYMQAELLHLQQRLFVITSLDHNSPDGTEQAYENRAKTFLESETAESNEQWNVVVKVRGKLSVYNAALLQQAQLLKLPAARGQDLGLLNEWLHHPGKGGSFLEDVEAMPWDSDHIKDLVALSQGPEFDSFTKMLAGKFVPWIMEKFYTKLQKLVGFETTAVLDVKDEWLVPWRDR